MAMIVDGYLSVQETAARLGVSRQTVWRHIVSGDLPTFRTPRNSRVRLIAVSDVEAIEAVTAERARQRHDWSGKSWADLMIEAAEARSGEALADVLHTPVWPEDQ